MGGDLRPSKVSLVFPSGGSGSDQAWSPTVSKHVTGTMKAFAFLSPAAMDHFTFPASGAELKSHSRALKDSPPKTSKILKGLVPRKRLHISLPQN